MGGAIEWAALPLLAEMLGVEDPEAWIHRLAVIREEMKPKD